MRQLIYTILGVLAVAALGGVLGAHAPSGAIFTTLVDGSEVNFNQYPSREAVYLDGGPGPGAPAGAAGLDDGVYVFQVTNPSGKTLLSLDPAECRQFTVSGGVIVSTAPSACPHQTGNDVDHDAITVQLMPYAVTNNPGGVYKVWVTPLEDYLAGCADLGVANGLTVVDCGTAAGNFHGFIPAHSKTDNFKVAEKPIREIDTRFYIDADGNHWKSDDEPWVDGLGITWIDPLGASNKKYSYWAPWLSVFHEAHVEGIENGLHRIVVADQVGCRVHTVLGAGTEAHGPTTVLVDIKGNQNQDLTVFIDVGCYPD